MASRTAENRAKPVPGQILIVIHDFSARGSDELSLSKGDRVELIEGDDGFGDGWYLGRHLINGNSGLFPEVYTRIAPRESPLYSSTHSSHQPFVQLFNTKSLHSVQTSTKIENPNGIDSVTMISKGAKPNINPHLKPHDSIISTSTPAAAPLVHSAMLQPIISTSVVKSQILGQESPVMNETLSVIDEHITDLNSPHQTIVGRNRRGTNNSGSDYSSHTDSRLSFIHGDETDDDESDIMHTREQIIHWTPDQVSEYLFTIGVEPKHCEVLRDQDITGDVLLSMDQSTIFLKEFDFGSVGRRLKTWQKIKFLQDEAKRDISTYSADLPEDIGRLRSCSTNSPSVVPRMHGLRTNFEPSIPNASIRTSQDFNVTGEEMDRVSLDFKNATHSRRGSSNKMFSSYSANSIPDPNHTSLHRKQASFDGGWSMQTSASALYSNRPSLASGTKMNRSLTTRSSIDNFSTSMTISPATEVNDYGYFSSSEAESRYKSVAQRRGSIGMMAAHHSRNSSSTDENRSRGSPSQKRHSRFGSVDSTRDCAPPSASTKYYGLAGTSARRRTSSEVSTTGPTAQFLPKDSICSIPPAVTKLSGTRHTHTLNPPEAKQGKNDFITTMKSASNGRFGLRAISDAVTGHEKSRMVHPPEPTTSSSSKYSPNQSSSRTGSSINSGGLSFELESPGPKSTSSLISNSSNGRNKKKSKKETSAYTCGLEKRSPLDAITAADYSGWMKKKSTNLMASWKSRLFILKGRRLSYYYSEDDDGERGLIDISFHRVLPVDNDRLTGLHATLTGASHTSATHNLDTAISTSESSAELNPTSAKGSESIFIFKLVPPRAGLQRAVTFTKPTVHYFAVPNVKQGRLWMAALMKATIERDESAVLKSTYQQKTISLAKARAMRHRPPALMNVDEQAGESSRNIIDEETKNINADGTVFNTEYQEGKRVVSELSKFEPRKYDSVIQASHPDKEKFEGLPNSA
ncbi:hypothetical protein K3495_g1021 [Podosphaera aphanis]|nr:hypothetical protein K3495_g1021 [Podosphaera aphanis]